MKHILSLLALVMSYNMSPMMHDNKQLNKKHVNTSRRLSSFFEATTKNRVQNIPLREIYINHHDDYLHQAWYMSKEFSHADWVWSVNFDPTSTALAVGGSDSAYIHNLNNPQESFAVLQKSKNVVDAYFSPCGKYLAATKSRTIKVINLEEKKVIIAPPCHYVGYINAASFDPTGKYLATGGDDLCLIDLSCTSSIIEEREKKDLYIDCKKKLPFYRLILLENI